jgi:hypothetical protein
MDEADLLGDRIGIMAEGEVSGLLIDSIYSLGEVSGL